MLTIDDYIDLAKKRIGAKSDTKVAEKIGIKQSSITQYRSKRAWPSDATMMRLADICGMDRGQALIFLNVWRCTDGETQSQYKKMANDYQENHPQIMQMMISAPFKTRPARRAES